jgi:hypothetical protein
MLERAKENAVIAVDKAKLQLSQTQSEFGDLRRERRRMYDDGYEETDMEAIENQISAKEWEVEEAERAVEEARILAEREIEDAEQAVRDAIRQKSENEQRESAETRGKNLSSGRIRLAIEEKQAQIAELEVLLAEGGLVTAKAGQTGLVTALNLDAGDITSGAGAFLITGQGGSLFTALGTKKETDRLSPGDPVEIELTGIREPITAEVADIKPPVEPGGRYTVTVDLLKDSAEGVQPNTQGTLTAVKRAGSDTQLLPLTALYTEGGVTRGYVFLLRERDTTMGMRTIAERLDIEIIDRGKSMAAVVGAFSPDDKVITASSRVLIDGDFVRLDEENES